MKTIKLILTIIIVGLTTQAFAQPQKARNATFKLVTYKANGEKIATTEGVFISKDGIALGAWNPFKGAAKAEISDLKGKPIPYHAYMEPTNSTMWLNLKLQT